MTTQATSPSAFRAEARTQSSALETASGSAIAVPVKFRYRVRLNRAIANVFTVSGNDEQAEFERLERRDRVSVISLRFVGGGCAMETRPLNTFGVMLPETGAPHPVLCDLQEPAAGVGR